MNGLQVFNNPKFGQVRGISIDDEPWLIGKDITDRLEYQNGSRDINRHVDEEDRQIISLFDGKQNRDTIIINESGLYSLVLSSHLPTAKQFKHWVTSEVLPSIRKHGMYATDELLNNPDFAIKVFTELKQEREEKQELSDQIEQQKPLVDFASKVGASENSLLVREVAKLACKQGINIGEKRLWAKLREWGLIFKNSTEAKQEYVDRGYFEVIEGVHENSKGSFVHKTTRVTGKGQIYIIDRLKKEAA